ncbi:phospholipase D family protein [Roseovarius sp. EL26]|uniref:phospholipase D family protein n=1 Tax=Roseovarius sp. EL26 TaxID=2126672 RepID=UPI000EA27F44|nr:phospholipase D family protein [Roseovarius sp. EL26]
MKRFVKRLLTFFALCAIAIFTARLLFSLPDITDRTDSIALPAQPDTALGALMHASETLHPGKSGVAQLLNNHDALASRLALIKAAERSIDAQYYIWHDDTSGILLLDALHKAAKRGVRVRLLLDDNGVPGLDSYMSALNDQDNFEIRLFNPSTLRKPKLLGYTYDFFRMNRRMHNKSLTVDGAATIIGGRNIGDEYFQVGDDQFYIDLDVLATGAVVPETANAFDDYWNSPSVFAVEAIVNGVSDIKAFETRVTDVRNSIAAKDFLSGYQDSTSEYIAGTSTLEWTDVQLVIDDPSKGMGRATRDQLMITRLGAILGRVNSRLDLVSAYFVPGKQGTEWLAGLSQSGIDVRVLTNAMDTTDVILVHSGYAKYRRELLETGTRLFELKLRGKAPEKDDKILPFGLSGASLHAKTFAVDDKRIFIGSFNFDPRSAMLNCEMGFLIDSPSMAAKVSAGFDGSLTTVSYEPELTPENKMIWREPHNNGDVTIYQEEPGASWFEQIALVLIGLLPIEWLL